MIVEKTWAKYYKDRVASPGYNSYFDKRYMPMLGFIQDRFKEDTPILEEGIGIGSLARALYIRGYRNYIGYDLSEEMLLMCKKNLAYNQITIPLYNGDITEFNHYIKGKLVVTHGVLEHFCDIDIRVIFNRYKREKVPSIHYVPTDGYDTPSFGNERLLPVEYWVDLVKPDSYLTFNDNKDLVFLKL